MAMEVNNYDLIKNIPHNLNIFEYVKKIICGAITDLYKKVDDFKNIIVEFPKNQLHGDFSTNVAMVLAGKFNINPQQIAKDIRDKLNSLEFFSSVEIAGPGFINIKTHKQFWFDFAVALYKDPQNFHIQKIGENKKVLIEFVSANPTGPMHVGHCRGAIYGDALSNLLEALGYAVTREYYINDAGSQILTLSRSLLIRYQQLCGLDVSLEDNMYPGQYLIPIAQDLKATYGESLLNVNFDDNFPILREFAVSKIMDIIKSDLSKLGVTYNSFISEFHDIHQKNYIDKAVKKLTEMGLLYKGILDAPKGVDVDDWEPQEQMIFKSSVFGDDIDRVVQRADGSYTYFAGDLGLALQRIERGYKEIILPLGADHIGFVKRMKAIIKALGDSIVQIDLPITQMVNLLKNGQPFKMSKRSGNFITADDVIDEVGIDALRFTLLARKNDTIIDFDFEKVKEQTKENPVFYVQYAHARCLSILRNAKSEFNWTPNILHIEKLDTDADCILLRKILSLPKVIEQAAHHREPHRIINYLNELATEFHSLWAQGNSENSLRFIIAENQELTEGRLVLVDLVRVTITIALDLLGIKALERM